MMTPDDRRVALEVQRLIDRRIDFAIRNRLPAYHYGPVFAVDEKAGTCSVLLKGLSTPHPGFVYGGTPPRVGDLVRAWVHPNGDQWVSVLGRDLITEIVDIVTPPAIPPDRALHIPIRVAVAAESELPALAQPVTTQATAGGGAADVVLDAAPAEGTILVAWQSTRAVNIATTPPSGWNIVSGLTISPGSDFGRMIWRPVGPGETDTIAVTRAAGPADPGGMVTVWNIAGVELAADADNEADVDTGTMPAIVSGGPITPAAARKAIILLGIAVHSTDSGGQVNFVAPDSGFTQDAQVWTGAHPLHYAAHQIIDGTSGAAYSTDQGFSGFAANFGGWGGQVVAFLGSGSGPGGFASVPQATDGDDATYTAVTGTEALRIDLGAAYRIIRARVVLGCETAGAKSYELRAANEGDYSDEVTVATVAFTAAGAFATNAVTVVWPSTTAYRFWRLVGPDEVRRVHTLELYETTAGETVVTDPTTGLGADIDAALAALAASIVTDHGALTGLADNDHPQYLTQAEADALYEALGGGGVSDILTLPTTETDVALVLAPNGAGGVEFRAEAGGAGGVGWSLDVEKPGTSFAGFTAASGTWSSNGTEIIQTDTGSAQRRVKYNTLVPIGLPTILEVEAQIVSVGGGGIYRAGLLISDGSNGGGVVVYIDQGASNVSIEADAATLMRSISRAFSTGTWYKLRVVIGSWYLSIYVDGTLIGNAPVTRGEVLDDNGEFVGLYSYAASVKFRNFKVWTLSAGTPA